MILWEHSKWIGRSMMSEYKRDEKRHLGEVSRYTNFHATKEIPKLIVHALHILYML